MTDDNNPLALHPLPAEAVHRLVHEFDTIAQLVEAETAAQWATWWWWHTSTKLSQRLGIHDVAGPEPTQYGLNHMDDGELVVLSGWFADMAANNELPGLADWCRRLVSEMHDVLARRTHERHPEAYDDARVEAQFQIIAAEENRLEREGKPPPDLRGLPSWSEISNPPDAEM